MLILWNAVGTFYLVKSYTILDIMLTNALLFLQIFNSYSGVWSFVDKVSVTCNAGWTKFGENCYHKYGHAVQWIQAMQKCKAEGGALVDIGSQEEQSFVQSKWHLLNG